MEIVVERIAGLDVHKDSVVASVRAPGERVEGASRYARSGPASQLGELAEWLAAERVDQAVMEATGVYWKPVWYSLEGAVGDLLLVNATHVKKVPGRTTRSRAGSSTGPRHLQELGQRGDFGARQRCSPRS